MKNLLFMTIVSGLISSIAIAAGEEHNLSNTNNSISQQAKTGEENTLDSIWDSQDTARVHSLIKAELDKEINDSVSLSVDKLKIARSEKIIKLHIHEKTPSGMSETIGYIFFFLHVGVPEHFSSTNDPIIVNNIPPKCAFFYQIVIDNQYQGRGLSTKALNIFHKFLDRIGADFTILEIDSPAPYAGRLYKNTGYVFTPNTINAINAWGKQQGITSETEAEAMFLKDTTQPLGRAPFMIRYKKDVEFVNTK
jgi:hypothetical protein